MADLAKLAVEVTGKGIAQVKRGLDQFTLSAKKAEKGNNSLKTSTVGVSSAFGGLGAALGTISATAFISSMARAADTMTTVENKLKLVTDSTENLNAVQDALFAVSQRTYSSLSDTVDLYSRLARSTKEYGTTQSEVLEVTEAMQQAFLVSGANAQEASAAVIQLGQGLASGALRGDELRSVLEQAPRLARALADGLGVSVGKLREMGAEGELTTEKVFTSILSQTKQINAEFEDMRPTIAQAATDFYNTLIRSVGVMDDLSNSSNKISATFLLASRGLDTLVDGLKEFGQGVPLSVAEAATMFSKFLTDKMAGVREENSAAIESDIKRLQALSAAGFDRGGVGSVGESASLSAKEIEKVEGAIARLTMSAAEYKKYQFDKEFEKLKEKAKGVTPEMVELRNAFESFQAKAKQKEAQDEIKKVDSAVQELQDRLFGLTHTAQQNEIYQVQQWYNAKAALVGYTDELVKARDVEMQQVIKKYDDKDAEAKKKIQEEVNRAILANEQTSAYQRIEIVKAMYAAKIASAEEYGLSVAAIEAEKSEKIKNISDQERKVHGTFFEGLKAGFKSVSEESQSDFERAQVAAISASNAMESGFSRFFDISGKGFKDWGDAAMSIIKDVVNAMMQAAVVKPLTGAIMGGLTGMFGGGLSSGTLAAGQAGGATLSPSGSHFMPRGHAKGAVFPAGDISAYSGSVVSSPTFFTGNAKPFAKGGNVMGEAGPEAILPLSRGKGGKLGVKMSGGGGSVSIVINNYGEPVESETKQSEDSEGNVRIEMLMRPIKAAVAKDIATNGTGLNRAVKWTSGVNRGSGMAGGL